MIKCGRPGLFPQSANSSSGFQDPWSDPVAGPCVAESADQSMRCASASAASAPIMNPSINWISKTSLFITNLAGRRKKLFRSLFDRYDRPALKTAETDAVISQHLDVASCGLLAELRNGEEVLP
jgi:hypothetical protein